MKLPQKAIEKAPTATGRKNTLKIKANKYTKQRFILKRKMPKKQKREFWKFNKSPKELKKNLRSTPKSKLRKYSPLFKM